MPTLTLKRRFYLALLTAALLAAAIGQVFKVQFHSFEDGSGAVAWCVPGQLCE